MREVVVSAAAPDGTLRTTPHSVSIITADDIERSTAITVGELLAREATSAATSAPPSTSAAWVPPPAATCS
jgi:outer membrane cobalamin receptor